MCQKYGLIQREKPANAGFYYADSSLKVNNLSR